LYGLFLFLQPCLNLSAQALSHGPNERILTSYFIKPEVFQQAGQISFNVVRVRNTSDTAVSIKPIIVAPPGWGLLSLPFTDTIIQPGDSISLAIRFRLPSQLSAETDHDIFFRAYSKRNQLLTECNFSVTSEPFHDWEVKLPEKRVFFYPRMNLATFTVTIQNKGNVTEEIDLKAITDKKTAMIGEKNWSAGEMIRLAPYQDTLIKFFVRYTSSKDRVFDISRVHFVASGTGKDFQRSMMIEKYSDIFAPLYIDRSLPHLTEVGFRTFSGNRKVLPFIKARGSTIFENSSVFRYNFNYYSQTGSENLISNTYYNFTYDWGSFRAGIGAFSSQFGRNLYTRNGVMISNGIQLSPDFRMEGMLAQSFFIPKTSAGVGYAFNLKKIQYTGSLAFDSDNDKKVNTTSAIFRSDLIPLFNNHDFSFSVYGYRESNFRAAEYILQGVAWDLHYYARISDKVSFKITNNYGSPNIPGPQMGLLNLAASPIFMIGNSRNMISMNYVNASRRYYTYDFEGSRMPETRLYDQYANILFHFNSGDHHTWQAGPSLEYYQSFRPSLTNDHYVEYQAEKLRLEYKSVVKKNLSLNIKTGVSNINIKDIEETNERRYDFHLMGGYSFGNGYSISFGYDYGPMVNSGLYQFAGDFENHSMNIGPTITDYFFKERVAFNLFTNFIYRFDLNYAAVNVNPRIEAFLFRDWYVVMSGTYHYTRQEYPQKTTSNSHIYFEFGLRKRWGKTDFNKWQKDTRRLKVVLFRDDNGDGQKDDLEQGIPHVKTRIRLTNSITQQVSTEFPVDVTLLSNEAGMVIYNRLPIGFYDLSIIPLEDVQEYFYVDRSAEKIELTQNTTVYIPFQKASKITGKINVKRQQFIKKGEEGLDLRNIRITAYNAQGNSYSAFTLEDGSFTIFVPNNNTYWVRMGNVFGDNFRITNNDMILAVSDGSTNHAEFNVVEGSRQIRFKKADEPALPDTLEEAPLKVKVLHGKFYETAPEQAVDKDAVPSFDIQAMPLLEQAMIPGRFYVITGDAMAREEALKYLKIVRENGINAYLGHHEATNSWYVFTNHYDSRSEAQREVNLLKKPGLREARVIRF